MCYCDGPHLASGALLLRPMPDHARRLDPFPRTRRTALLQVNTPTDASTAIVANQYMSSAIRRSSDDSDWPVHSSMLSGVCPP